MNTIKHLCSVALFSVLLFSLHGCGYAFEGGGSVLPQDVKKVYVPLVENSSTEGGLSSVLTESVRDQLEKYGVLTVVDDINDADAVFKGRITKVKRTTLTTTGGTTDTALQYSVTMTVNAELRRITGAVLWRNQNLTVSKSFGTASDVVTTGSADFALGGISSTDLTSLDTTAIARGQQQQSLQYMADQVAEEIYSEAVAPDF